MRQDKAASHTARLRRLRRSALALVHPDAQLVDAVECRKVALLDETPPTHTASLASRAFSALVVGELATARDMIARLLPEDECEPLPRVGLVSQLYAWSGDALGTRPMLTAAVREVERAQQTPDCRVVARDLIALAEACADGEAGRRLRQLARGADPDQGTGGVLLRQLAAPQPAGLRNRTRQDAATADPAGVAAALTTGRTDTGVDGWTRLARARDSEDPDDLLVPLLAVGILGLDPDAERGRLRARLHAPTGWPAWGATAIRLGDAAVDLGVTRDSGIVEITAEQTEGPLPLTLIIEVTVHAPVRTARVDETDATLTLRSFPDRIIAPVQLVLETPRTLRLELEARD